MTLHVAHEFLCVLQARQGVCVRARQELDAAGVGQCLEFVYHLGHVELQLLDGRAAHAQGALERSVSALDHIPQSVAHRHIRILRQAGDDVVVREIIEIVVVVTYVEETVTFQPERLMYVEIKTN